MNPPPPLKHEVALLGEEEILAPVLEEQCGGDSLTPEAQRISWASSRRLLRCAVCGVTVKKVFGTRKRWHFALFPGIPPCDHENETVDHRESKLALYHALKLRLPGGWSVLLEQRLENGRRPDVLAVHESGVRVAFEVQYADLSEKDWRMRHEDYAKLDARDVWMLGHAREDNKRDALANVLAATEGQRIIYVGRREDERNVRVREAIFSSGLSRGDRPYGKPGNPSPGAFAGGWSEMFVAEWVKYGLGAIKLLEDGALHTPADVAFERLWRKAEWEQRQEELRRKAAEERRRKEAEREAKTAAEAERRRKWGEERRAQETLVWKESSEREKARGILGDRVLKLLEAEGSLDKNIYCPAGQWKTAFFLSRIHGRPPGTVFDWYKAAGAVLREHPHNKRERGKWAWAALRGFIEGLAREGLVELDRCDVKGRDRYWRTPLSSRRAEEHQGAARDAERQAELEEKWERNRRTREEHERLEKAESERHTSQSRSLELPRLDREQRLERQELHSRWLASEDRRRARIAFGWRLLNRLEKEEEIDRVILAHPGDWKAWLFLRFVHGKAQGSTFDHELVTVEALGRFETTSTPLATEAVHQYVLLLRDEGFLVEPRTDADTPTEKRQIYVVVGTAKGWNLRLEERIKDSRDKHQRTDLST